MATLKQATHSPLKTRESLQPLIHPTQSQTFQQAKTSWRESWQAMFEQCSDFFVRY